MFFKTILTCYNTACLSYSLKTDYFICSLKSNILKFEWSNIASLLCVNLIFLFNSVMPIKLKKKEFHQLKIK